MPFQIMRFRELMKKLMDVDCLEESLSQIVRVMEAELSFQSLGIFFHNENKKSFRLKISRNLSHAYTKRTEYDFDDNLVLLLRNGDVIQSSDPKDLPYEKSYVHLIAAPLLFHNELLGFIFIDNAERRFSDEEMALLDTFATVCSLVGHIYKQAHQIQNLSIFDAVTGLFTYRNFYQRAVIAFQQANRYNHPLSIVVLKLGKYKELYRKLGAVEASKIISGTATALMDNLRVMEVIGLIYPDTVAILLPESPTEDIDFVLKRLQNTILEVSSHLADSMIAWGVASMTTDYKDCDDMIRHAEEAAFEAIRLDGSMRLKHASPDLD
ncbi:MAG: diguanylate cyclase [Candidatus Cloacimonetes bacterium]|nr:diguanylate cyclase [Candidatus Cloacimonadota bacterium]